MYSENTSSLYTMLDKQMLLRFKFTFQMVEE